MWRLTAEEARRHGDRHLADDLESLGSTPVMILLSLPAKTCVRQREP